MRVAFIIPDKRFPWDSVHQGVGYVAAYAREHTPIAECRVFRTYGTSDADCDRFLDHEWDVIGLTVTEPAVEEVRGLIPLIRSRGSAKIVVGGAEITSLEERTFDQMPGIDYAVSGEGEITFCELLRCLESKGDPSQVKGLIYRNQDGELRKNASRPFEKTLEVFPYPDRELFEYEYAFHSIIGTRGCPYRCTFCNSSANWRHTYRTRKPESIAEEVKYVITLYGRQKHFAFNDDSFNINGQWVLRVCDLLRGLHIKWGIRGLRAGLVTEEMANRLAESGCVYVGVGVESANNRSLEVMQKATTIEEIVRGTELLQASGIPVTGQFIIGNQGDTLETVKESIECARKFMGATFGVAYPLPHTHLYDFVEKHKYFLPEPVPVKYKGVTIDHIMFDTPWFPVEDRLAAVNLAVEAKLYHNIDYGLPSGPEETEQCLDEDQDTVGRLEEEIRKKDHQIALLTKEVKEKNRILDHIYNSGGWKTLLAYYKLRDGMFPENSKRRFVAKRVYRRISGEKP